MDYQTHKYTHKLTLIKSPSSHTTRTTNVKLKSNLIQLKSKLMMINNTTCTETTSSEQELTAAHATWNKHEPSYTNAPSNANVSVKLYKPLNCKLIWSN